MSRKMPSRRPQTAIDTTRVPGRSRSPNSPRPRKRFLPGIDRFEARALLSTLLVTNVNDGGPGSLRAAIAAAAGGDSIEFDRRIGSGTIRLTSGELVIDKSLDIEGPGASRLAVDGGGLGRAFRGDGPGVVASIEGLTIRGGKASLGGGVLDELASLTLEDDLLVDNQAPPRPPRRGAQGGAVAVVGMGASLRVEDSVLARNLALGAASLGGPRFADTRGGSAQGGAIFTDPGTTLAISDSSFAENRAIGGAAGPGGTDFFNGLGGSADGGAIAADPGGSTVSIRESRFEGNQAIGGLGGRDGSGFFNGFAGSASGGALTVRASSFPPSPGSLAIFESSFARNEARGGSGGTGSGFLNGAGGSARGGAVEAFSGALTIRIDRSSFDRNAAEAGAPARPVPDRTGHPGGPPRAGRSTSARRSPRSETAS